MHYDISYLNVKGKILTKCKISNHISKPNHYSNQKIDLTLPETSLLVLLFYFSNCFAFQLVKQTFYGILCKSVNVYLTI